MTAAARRFVFAPLERRGLLLGLTPIQLASLAGGALMAMVAIHAAPDPAGILAGLILALGGAAVACLPVAGRPPVAWLPVAGGWARRRARGPAIDRTPTLGTTTVLPLPPRTAASPSPSPSRRAGARLSRRPVRGRSRGRGGGEDVPTTRSDTLGSAIEIVEAPALPGQPALAVLRDRVNGTWATALPVRGRAFALLDPEDKERRLGAWGAVLAGMARNGSPVHRLQWVERSFAGDGDALSRYLAEAGTELPTSEAPFRPSPWPDAGPQTSLEAAREGYADLIAAAGPTTLEHDSLVVLAIRPRRVGRSIRSFGRGPDAVVGLLRREVRLLQGQLRGAELVAGDPLDGPAMALALRAPVDPGARRRSDPAESGRRRMGPAAWPLASDEAWSSLRTDGSWHATFWIAEWPRLEVGPDFLAPLLLAGAHRTVSVTMAPVPPERARRQVEAARTAEAADEELRRSAGFLSTARRRRESEGVAQREVELADGHAEYRFSGYVTVSAAERTGLEAACSEIEQVAQQARLELRRLYGQQREAFTWTLPLARGLA
jgi:hypothetical protein